MPIKHVQNLHVPVDESGTATGRPEPAPDTCAELLRRLCAEAQHYVNTGTGVQHLRNALYETRRWLEKGGTT